MTDLRSLYTKGLTNFADAVGQIGDQWTNATPCTEWDVRALMNHLVSEQLWLPPLLEGKTIADVGDAYDGDVLGEDPVGAWDKAADAAAIAVADLKDLQSITHLSFADVPAEEYLMQMLFDLHIHGWDLRSGVNADATLDAELTEFLFPWTERTMGAYRAAGVVAPPPPVPENASRQTQMLALAGRKG